MLHVSVFLEATPARDLRRRLRARPIKKSRSNEKKCVQHDLNTEETLRKHLQYAFVRVSNITGEPCRLYHP